MKTFVGDFGVHVWCACGIVCTELFTRTGRPMCAREWRGPLLGLMDETVMRAQGLVDRALGQVKGRPVGRPPAGGHVMGDGNATQARAMRF